MLTADQGQLLIAGFGLLGAAPTCKGQDRVECSWVVFCFHFHIGAAVYGVGFGGGSPLEEVVEFHAAIDRI